MLIWSSRNFQFAFFPYRSLWNKCITRDRDWKCQYCYWPYQTTVYTSQVSLISPFHLLQWYAGYWCLFLLRRTKSSYICTHPLSRNYTCMQLFWQPCMHSNSILLLYYSSTGSMHAPPVTLPHIARIPDYIWISGILLSMHAFHVRMYMLYSYTNYACIIVLSVTLKFCHIIHSYILLYHVYHIVYTYFVHS